MRHAHIITGVLVGCLMPLGALAQKNTPNLIYNPGFEEPLRVDMVKEYKILIDSGARLPPGDTALMPAGWWLNPNHGWTTAGKAGGARFEYVQGNAGQDIHSGKRAVKVISPGIPVALVVGGTENPCLTGSHPYDSRIAVLEAAAPEEAVLVLETPYTISFYAKGKGTVSVMAYGYRANGAYEQSLGGLIVVKPESITVADESQWRLYSGTLTATKPAVGLVLLAFLVKGETWLDDFCLEKSP